MEQIMKVCEQLPARELESVNGKTTALDLVLELGKQSIVGSVMGRDADELVKNPLKPGMLVFVRCEFNVRTTEKDGRKRYFQSVRIIEITPFGHNAF